MKATAVYFRIDLRPDGRPPFTMEETGLYWPVSVNGETSVVVHRSEDMVIYRNKAQRGDRTDFLVFGYFKKKET